MWRIEWKGLAAVDARLIKLMMMVRLLVVVSVNSMENYSHGAHRCRSSYKVNCLVLEAFVVACRVVDTIEFFMFLSFFLLLLLVLDFSTFLHAMPL